MKKPIEQIFWVALHSYQILLNQFGTLQIYYSEMHKTAHSYSPPKHKYHTPLSQRFPQDIQCIIQSPYRDYGSLYISNIQAAENPTTLQRYSIKAVLSCAKGYQLSHSKSVVLHYLYIGAVDHQSCDIYPHFEQAVNFIQQHLKTTNVLVHCLAGVSRSVSMVIAYLIRQHSMTDLQAFNFVKSRRNIVNPNEGFREQLKKYHKEVSSSYSRNRSQKNEKKSPKKIVQQYRLYKDTPVKHTRTSSTNQKSFQEQTKERYRYLNAGNKSIFLSSHRKMKTQNQMDEYHSIRKYNCNFEGTNKYFSPPKIHSYRQIRKEIIPNPQKNRGYFQNLRQDLDERIEKIKQKYDIQRQKFEQRYQKPNIENTTFEVKYHPNPMKSQHELKRLKTQSFHQYNKQIPNFIIDTQREDNQKKYPNIDNLFPKKFHIQAQQKSLQKSPSYINGTFILNNYSRVKTYRTKNEELLAPTTYANFKNNLSRSRY